MSQKALEEYKELLNQMNVLRIAGNDEGIEYDDLCDEADEYWWKLTKDEIIEANKHASQLIEQRKMNGSKGVELDGPARGGE